MQVEVVEKKNHPFIMYDNCVHPDDQQKILDAVLDPNFNWAYNKVTAGQLEKTSEIIKDNIHDCNQFVHPLVDSRGPVFSPFTYVSDIISNSLMNNLEMEIEAVDRIKVNYLHKQANWQRGWYNMPHCDKHLEGKDDEPWISVIYYVDDADGDTYFFNKFWGEDLTDMRTETTLSPKRGRLVMFHSTRYHTSSPPIDYSKRIIVNCVYKVKENS